MKRRAASLAIGGLLIVAAAGLSAQVFRGGTDVVVLNVTVVDAENHFITGLERTDFQIIEDGVLQDITASRASSSRSRCPS